MPGFDPSGTKGSTSRKYKPGATSANSEKGTNRSEGGSKGNYTAQRIGNDKGSINFGLIAQNASCTKGVSINTPDGNHTMYMDIDGKKK